MAALCGLRAMSSDDKKKKLKEWKNAQKSYARAEFPLSADNLEALFDSLDSALEKHGCEHTYRFTQEWLEQAGHSESLVIPWLQANGGYCDCEILANVEQHFEENR